MRERNGKVALFPRAERTEDDRVLGSGTDSFLRVLFWGRLISNKVLCIPYDVLVSFGRGVDLHSSNNASEPSALAVR